MASKKMQAWFEQYNRSRWDKLEDVYGRFSEAKRSAYDECMNVFYELHGMRPRIIGYNTMAFTFGFTYPDPETGEMIFRVETYCNTYECKLADLD